MYNFYLSGRLALYSVINIEPVNVHYASKLCNNIYLQDNVSVTIHEPVPQQFVRLLIRKHGSDNFRVIEKECSVKITWPKFSGREKDVFFTMKGLGSNCERAKEMLKANMVSTCTVNDIQSCIYVAELQNCLIVS